MNNALIIELRNPSDETHIFRFDAGARVGRMPSNGNIVMSANAISFSVPGRSSRWVGFTHTGELVTPQSIDDIYSTETDCIVAEEGNTTHVSLPNNWATADLPVARRAFYEASKNHIHGIYDEPERGLGGYRLMATFSRLKSERTGQCAIYSPNALGFDYDNSVNGLHHHLVNGNLTLDEAYGRGYNCADSIRLELTNNTDRDIELSMAPGTAFEQVDQMSNQQNVVLRDEIEVTILPGDTATITAHGMCANQSGGSPNGALLATPFRLMDASNIMNRSGDAQRDLWARTDTTGTTGRM